MRMNTASKGMRGQAGIALVEALIAILLFSLGILMLVGLQAAMTKNVTHAKLRAEAAFLANQLIGQMWVDQANLSKYAVSNRACTTEDFNKCTNWLAQVGQALPGGQATVTVTNQDVRVVLNWQLPGDGEVSNQFQIDAAIHN